MYYFGTNLDQRFSVPDFWPKPEETHKIPFEREEMAVELQRLRERRLRLRTERLERERKGLEGVRQAEMAEGTGNVAVDGVVPR
jgi:protein PET100